MKFLLILFSMGLQKLHLSLPTDQRQITTQYPLFK